MDFKQNKKELQDIYGAVVSMVSMVMSKAASNDSKWKCSEILRVGSVEEGTKIIEPNEFDFLCVLKSFRTDRNLLLRKMCTHNPGYAHLFIENDELQKEFGFAMNEGQLSAKDLFRKFDAMISDVYTQLTPAMKDQMKEERDSGTLNFGGFSLIDIGPNIILRFYWIPTDGKDQIDINVDLSPAIRYSNMENIINPMECLSHWMTVRQAELDSVLLVTGGITKPNNTCSSKCIRISCTELEVKLVQCLSDNHRRCYKVLKYIVCHLCMELSISKFSYKPISSYILKNAVIQHSINCHNEENKECLGQILILLLDCIILKGSGKPHLSNIFCKDHNLLSSIEIYQTYEMGAIHLCMHVHVLSGLLEFHRELVGHNKLQYSFDHFQKRLNFLMKRLDEMKARIWRAFYEQWKVKGSWNFDGNSVQAMLDIFQYPVKILTP